MEPLPGPSKHADKSPCWLFSGRRSLDHHFTSFWGLAQRLQDKDGPESATPSTAPSQRGCQNDGPFLGTLNISDAVL